jgi:predicted transcriptional regulator
MDIRSLISEVTSRRRALALTQDELSRRSGVSRRTIIAMEAGQTDIGISRLARLLDAMDLALAVVPRASRPTESQLRDIFKDDDE